MATRQMSKTASTLTSMFVRSLYEKLSADLRAAK